MKDWSGKEWALMALTVTGMLFAVSCAVALCMGAGHR